MGVEFSEQPKRYVLALGSSLGDKLSYLQSACQQLSAHPRINLVACAPVYETPPVGAATATFANSAVIIATDLLPVPLLVAVKAIERALGRKPRGRWQDREIDIDLVLQWQAPVFYCADPELWLPHKLMLTRAFVLAPAKDIAPRWRHPYSGRTVAEAWQELCAKDPSVARLKKLTPLTTA